MTDALRPLPNDPSAETVKAMFDLDAGDWILTGSGDYQTAAAEVWRADGANFQRVVIVEWPGRRNHTTEAITVRLMLAPEDALGLAAVLKQTAEWMLEAGA